MTTEHFNKPLLGILCMVSAAAFLSVMNLLTKQLGSIFSANDIVILRNIATVSLLIFGLIILRRLELLKTARPGAQFIRAVVGTAAFTCFVIAFIMLPLGLVTALGFTAPLFTALLSYPLLKERVSWQRFLAIAVGFSGVLVFVGPEWSDNKLGISLALFAGFLNGFVQISLRWLGRTEHTATTNFYFMLFGLLFCLFLMPFFPAMPVSAIPDQTFLLFLLGIVSLGSLLLKTQAYRYGDAALISPFSYTMILWAFLFDYLFYNRLPTASLLVGGSIIIGSNLFILYREHRKKKLMQTQPV